MDKITDSVRAFYEAYPYPPGDRVDCDGYQVGPLLSYIERTLGPAAPLRVLEAGCGRGLNLQAAAAAQPHVVFTGIDINRTAIAEAQGSVDASGLQNLRFQIADLMQPQSLPMVSGGYDLILSYGVIHHLRDAAAGLRRLRELLSPQGVVALMVDGQYGRQPLDRFLQALSLLQNEESDLETRLAEARALARVAEANLFRGTYWQGTSMVDEVEFADRCLHVHEQSYTVDGLWDLLAAAGLNFLRWLEPTDWRLPTQMIQAPLRERIVGLDALQRYRLVERLWERPKLTLLAIPETATPRRPLEGRAVAETRFRFNPQLKHRQDTQGKRQWQLRNQPPSEAQNLRAESILQQAKSLGEAFTGAEMVSRLASGERGRAEILQAIEELLGMEWLYRPHPEEPGSES